MMNQIQNKDHDTEVKAACKRQCNKRMFWGCTMPSADKTPLSPAPRCPASMVPTPLPAAAPPTPAGYQPRNL